MKINGFAERVENAKNVLSNIQSDLNALPELNDMPELIECCAVIDERYREVCAQTDEDDGLEPGTTWEDGGWGAEFYLEDHHWAEASKALARLIEKIRSTTPIQTENGL